MRMPWFLAAHVILLFFFPVPFPVSRIRRLIGFQPAGIFDNRWYFNPVFGPQDTGARIYSLGGYLIID